MSAAYLSDSLIYDSFQLGSFNLITAPCGSGKTVAAFKTIPEYLQVAPNRSLVLIDTRAGAEAFVNENYGYFFDFNGREWDANFVPQYDKPTIMTYASFGAQTKKNNLHLSDYDYIVCDEIHSLNRFIAMARGKLKNQYPQALPWELNDMLQVTNFNYIALEQIVTATKEGRIWVFGLTATPKQLYKNDLEQLGRIINEVQYSQKLHAYEIFCKFDYAEIEPILRAILPENRKRLFFFNSIKELKQYKQILLECGRAAESLWSLTASEPMNTQQLTTRDYVLNEHRFPDGIQDLLINSAYETAINIKDPLVKEAYIHTSNPDTREQARNRLRQNLECVGYYNHDSAKDHKKANNHEEKMKQYIQDIPACYFNRPLFTKDKEQLIEIIHFPNKWTSLKKALINSGLEVLDKNNGKARYSIIQRKI